MLSHIENSEILFIKDYLQFGLFLRKKMFIALHDKYIHSKDKKEKELYFLNSYFTLGTSYEDVSIICLALSEYYSNQRTYLIERLLNYRAGEAQLSKIIFGKTKKQIFNTFGLGEDKYMAIGLKKYDSKRLIAGIVKNLKITAKEQDVRIKIYNKLKHAGLVMSSDDITGEKQGPRVLVKFNETVPNLARNILPHNENEMKKMSNQIESNLRIIGELLMIYLINKYPVDINSYFPENEFKILRDALRSLGSFYR